MSDAHPPVHVHTSNKTANTISNVLAIAGFLILIIIVLWGLFHIATLSSGWFSSLFNSSKTPMTMSVPASAVSGEPVRVSWKYSTKDVGRYAFLYECTDGLQFGVPVVKQGETTVSLARVPCGSAFTLGNATSSVIVVPILGTSTQKTARMTMLFVPSAGGTAVNASASMIVNPNTHIPEPSAPVVIPVVTKPVAAPSKPSTTPTSPTPAPRTTGPSDLVVRVLSANTDASGMSVVTFDIANDGGSSTGTYYFTANLPTAQPYTFVSEPQASLAPGSHIVNTLRFSQTVNGTFTAIVDPSNLVRESNESNNAASQEVIMPYVNYNGYNSYPTYQY